MPCDAVNEHLLCRQWAAEDVCSHRYIALGCSVSRLENSLKRTLQSIQAWTPLPSTISVSIPRHQWCISAGHWHSWMDFLQGCYDRSWISNCATGLFVWFSFKKVQRWLLTRDQALRFVLFFLCKESLCTLTSCWDMFVFSDCLHWGFSCSSNDIWLLTP